MFYFRSIIIIVRPAYILPEVTGVDRSSRLLRFVLGPSSVEILLTLVCMSKKQHVERALRKFPVKFQENVVRDFCRLKRFGITMLSFPDSESLIYIQASKKSRS